MILGKKDKEFVETLKEERLDALKKLEVLQKDYNNLLDKYNSLNKTRTDDIDLFLSGTGLDITDLAYLSNKSIGEMKKIYLGETKLNDEEFYKFICKVFRELLRMTK